MSRISKWKLEKTKVKVVFRLQFHATHVPQTGWDKLFISFIPADTGKATAKTTKANVRNGTCKWADPIYETTRLLQDSKSKQYDEKLYKIIVAMGSSRASVLGEATVNLADYFDALKPSAVTIPLQGCNFGTILHITVQLLTSKTGFREFEQQRELRETGVESGINSHGDSTEEVTSAQIDKSARIKCKSYADELSSLEDEVNPREEYVDSATGFDGSSNTSGSLFAEKHETSSTHDIDSKSIVSGDLNVLSHSQTPHTVKTDPSDHRNTAQGSIASAQGWGSDNELATAYEENSRLRGSLELAESSYFNMKLEVSSLQSLADELGAETQRLSHQLDTETSSAEELAKEVSVMKSECLGLKDELKRVKDLKFTPQIPMTNTSNNLQFLKGIAVVEDKIRELQNKIYVVPHDGDTKFIYLELEALLDFLLDFKLANGEVTTSELAEPLGAIDAVKGQIFDLVRELDDAKVEKEALTRKMHQMECYYEALIQELEENQKRVFGELQILREEHSTCLYTLSVSKAEIETLNQDMNQQMLRFVDERNVLEGLNKELEKRATTSEAALRRARLNYSIAVDKLQKDLELLSSQVTSMFETNENLIKQALPLPPIKQLQNKEDDGTQLSVIQNHNSGLWRLEGRSSCVKEELYLKVQEELIEMYSVNLNLDIYSKALEQPLHEADAEIRIMKEKMDELVEELNLSTASQNQLMVRLQKATDDIHALNEFKYSSISQCSEMALQNQLLEDKLASISEENHLLAQKLKDSESAITECRSYQNKYSACLAENKEQSILLKQEAFENEKLANEMSLLKEKMAILKAKSDELVSLKEILEENMNFVQDKFGDLLASYNKQTCFKDNPQRPDLGNVEIKDAILQLEEILHNASARNSQLMEENQNLKSERAIADVSMSTVRSKSLMMKHKFGSGIQEMVTKLDVSNALVDKLQGQLESVANKLHLSSEMEEKYAQQNKLLLADLALLEDQMQGLTSNNGQLAQEISGLDSLAEEYGRRNLTITELMHDKQELALCLKDKTEESIKLSCEVSCLKDNLKVLHDELDGQRAYKDELERKVGDLTFQLDKCRDKLFDFEQQKAEVLHVREVATDLELEKSRLAHLLDQQNLLIEKLERNDNSYHASFQSQLLEMHDYSLAADVKLIYVANHYEALLEELVQQLTSSEECVKELRKEKTNLLTSLNSLRSDLEAKNKLLSDSNNEITDRLEEYKRKLTMMETRFSSDIVQQASEVGRLKNMMIDAEEEISYLTLSKEELEILVIVLKGKVEEQSASTTYEDELLMLRSKCNELLHKLSEQVLKTEEFKNLSIHLKELKDKAESECLIARGKRESEAQPAAVQDSLRIAFIKEQYESKIQELKQQLAVSRKHGEEMLLKLQDAIDEIENRKKSEALNLKKYDELSLRFSALEEELQSALAERREKSNGYDRTKAELECALLSLECCKEEKEKLAASLLEFDTEKSQLAIELSSVKEQLEILKSSPNFRNDEYGSVTEIPHVLNGSTGNSIPLFLEQDESIRGIEREISISILDGENSDPDETVQLQIVESNGKNSDIKNEHVGAQRLRCSMEHLHEELEKMKNENTVFNIGHDVGPGRQVPETEITQLHKANEELRSMFPLFDEISSGGNALERVLALEIELAEALKSKSKSSIHFQSSFLKQHSDEEAVFKSFRDINELIREMLELKGRHASMEAELREMHDRFSQLSLQFAEVEGERQKLKMTLKNVRASKNTTLNRSSSANVMDLTS